MTGDAIDVGVVDVVNVVNDGDGDGDLVSSVEIEIDLSCWC